MDCVKLSFEDSDFIAKVIREDLESLNENYANALKKGNEKTESVFTFLDTIGIKEPEIEQKKEELKEVRDKCVSDLNAKYSELVNKYSRCIELLLCGSSNCEN